MRRSFRPVADRWLYHVLNCGNNRGDSFSAAEDYLTFLKALAQTPRPYPFRLFAYCQMTNHFHLLLSPQISQAICPVLQLLSVAPTWHYRGLGRHRPVA